jgi:hypothetical protein
MNKLLLSELESKIESLLFRTDKNILDLDLENFSQNDNEYKELLIFLSEKIKESMLLKLSYFKKYIIKDFQDSAEKSIPSIKFLLINDFISPRTYGCLKRKIINDLEDIACYGIENFLDIRNFGAKSLKEIINLFKKDQLDDIGKKFNKAPSEDVPNIEDSKNQRIVNNIKRSILYKNEYLELGSYQKVGDKYGITRERVRQIINQGEELSLYKKVASIKVNKQKEDIERMDLKSLEKLYLDLGSIKAVSKKINISEHYIRHRFYRSNTRIKDLYQIIRKNKLN